MQAEFMAHSLAPFYGPFSCSEYKKRNIYAIKAKLAMNASRVLWLYKSCHQTFGLL